MSAHPDRTRHAYFCPKCRQDLERPEPGKCDLCGLPLAAAGYCTTCRGYWRLRVGQLCPEHGIPLEGESAEDQQELEDEARALDPGLDAVVVFEGTRMECTLVHAAVSDAGIETELDDAMADPLLPKLEASQHVPSRVLVPRRHAEEACRVIKDFEEESKGNPAQA